MIHHFEIKDAEEYGVECAIILYNIKFWEQTNRANRRNYKKGRYWTYNSAKAFSELFPYWSRRKISRLLAKLEEQGAIIKDNFNDNKYDQTLWYSPVNPFGQNCPRVWSESTNSVDESVQCTSTYINTDENTDNNGDLIEEIYQAYPKKVGKGSAIKAIKKAIKTIDPNELLEIVKIYSTKVDGQDKKFIPHPSTWFNDMRWEDDQSTWEKPTFNQQTSTPQTSFRI